MTEFLAILLLVAAFDSIFLLALGCAAQRGDNHEPPPQP